MQRQLNILAGLATTMLGAFNLLAAQDLPLTRYVDPFIGTDPNPHVHIGYGADAGDVFPGAVCPRGMLAWSPDTTHRTRVPGGYWYPDQKIEAFSLTHFSGRGVIYLLDFPFLPVIEPVDVSPGKDWSRYAAAFSHSNETASPGYYRVKFDNGIVTELTASPRTGMARFTFPAKSEGTILIDADTSVTIKGREVTGFHDTAIGGRKRSYTIYFVAQFDRPVKSARTWKGDNIQTESSAQGKLCGAILTFDTKANPVVQARVGISFVSLDNAKANLARENTGKSFATLRHEADAAWNTDLNRIQIKGGTDAQKRVFYTALYHCFMHPNLLDDVNGQYLGMDGKVHTVKPGHHQYQNIPAWDQYRSHAALTAVLTPGQSSDVMQSLVNYAQQDASARPDGGALPRWEQVNRNSGGMVGDGDDAIIGTSYAFGATRFDTKAALAAMVKGASDPEATSDGFLARAGLKQFIERGYVPKVSITLEYCNHDFALAQFAKALGDEQKWAEYQNRAQNWKKLWNKSEGYLCPRNSNGSWLKNFAPTERKAYTEGTAAQYVWMVNFNLKGLIDKMGGNDKAVERLNKFFTKLNSGSRNAETAWMGNEPCEGIPWTYAFAGAPARTQKVVRDIQTELFTAQPNGLPGNDDAGSLSSWYVFSALGLYPEIPGVAGYVVGSPLFPEAIIHLGNGSILRIEGKHASVSNPYVKSLKLNGRKYESCWIPWSALSNGATLSFNLGDKPTNWASQPDQAPPSFDTVKH